MLLRNSVIAILAIIVCAASIWAANLSGTTQLTVGTPSPTPTGSFPQFSTTGTIVTTYTAGQSLFPRSWQQSDIDSQGNQAEIKLAGGNVIENGHAYPFEVLGGAGGNVPQGDIPGNCFSGQVLSLSCFQNWYTSSQFPGNFVNPFNTYGMPSWPRSDNGWGSWNWDASWPQAYQWITTYLQQNNNGRIIAIHGMDEMPADAQYTMCYHSTTGGFAGMTQMMGLGFTSDSICPNPNVPNFPNFTHTPIPHIPMGPRPYVGLPGSSDAGFNGTTTYYEWFNNPTISDYAEFESGTGNAPYCSPNNPYGVDFCSRDNLNTIRSNRNNPNFAGALMIQCVGPQYAKGAVNTTQYNPATDHEVQAPLSPAAAPDSTWFAVAEGFSAVFTYVYDNQGMVNSRKLCPVNSTPQSCLSQTGCSPISANSYGGLGQDRWYGESAGFNLVKQVEPWVLQPFMTAPAGGCASGSACPSGGIVTAAKQGNGGKLVMFVNMDDPSIGGSGAVHTIAYDPAPYQGTVSSQAWQLQPSIDTSCGTQTTLTSTTDCGRGATQVKGTPGQTVNPWTENSTFPAGGTAPTTTGGCGNVVNGAPGAGGLCTLTMQPGEVDVFLYQ